MSLLFTKAELHRYLGFNDRWLILLGIPVVSVLSNTLFGGFDPELTKNQMLITYACALFYTSVHWLLGRYLTLIFRRKFPQPAANAKRLILIMTYMAVGVVAIKLLVIDWIESVYPTGKTLPFLLQVAIAYTMMMLVFGWYEWVYNFARFRRSELERERLAKNNMQTQLSVLRQQMNPHFLFNSLNTLASVIPENPARATRFTQRLAATYRRILEYRDRETVSLREELDCLTDYLFLLQTRFEEKLHFRYSLEGRRIDPCDTPSGGGRIPLPPHLAGLQVVPLASQLLVENAVKHNVVSSERPLLIEVAITSDTLTVTNSLNRRRAGVSSTHWGQANLRSRYAALSDREVIISETDEAYTVRVPLFTPVAAGRSIPSFA